MRAKDCRNPIPAPRAKEDDKAIAIPDRQTKVKPAKEKAATTSPGRELAQAETCGRNPHPRAAARDGEGE